MLYFARFFENLQQDLIGAWRVLKGVSFGI